LAQALVKLLSDANILQEWKQRSQDNLEWLNVNLLPSFFFLTR